MQMALATAEDLLQTLLTGIASSPVQSPGGSGSMCQITDAAMGFWEGCPHSDVECYIPY